MEVFWGVWINDPIIRPFCSLWLLVCWYRNIKGTWAPWGVFRDSRTFCSLWKKVERNEERQWPHLIFDRSWELQEGRNTVVAFGPRDKELKSTPRARIAKRVAATAEVRRITHIRSPMPTWLISIRLHPKLTVVMYLGIAAEHLLCKYFYLVWSLTKSECFMKFQNQFRTSFPQESYI